MVRTRNFILFLACAVFLIVAIGVTWTKSGGAFADTTEVTVPYESGLQFSATTSREAVVPRREVDRASRIASLRAELAAGRGGGEVAVTQAGATASSGTSSTDLATTTTEETDMPDDTELARADRCARYSQVQFSTVSNSPLQLETTTSARVVYQQRDTSPANLSYEATTTATQASNSQRMVVARLPLTTNRGAGPSCIPQDVIGVAFDGSLIRNNEHTIYNVFDASTQIGYAMDGTPLYGVDDTVTTGRCGGAEAGGEFRYYLSSDRDRIINCYAGVPAQL